MHVYYIIQCLLFIIYIYTSACVELLCLVDKKSRYSFKCEIQKKLFEYMCISDITYPNPSQGVSELYSPYDNQCEKLYTLLDNYNFPSFEK